LIAIVLLKENHKPQALLVVLPLTAVWLLWLGIKFLLMHAAQMPSSASLLLDTLVAGFTAGMGLVLLAAGRFRGMNRFVIVVLAFFVMAAAFGASVAGSMKFDEETAQLGVFFGVMTLAGLSALLIAGASCRRRFGAGKFVFWLGVWCVLLCMGMLFAVIGVVALVFTARGQEIPFWSVIGQFLMVGGIMGLIAYVFMLPFVVCALRSDLFRERIYGCFRRRGVPAGEAAAEAEPPHDWRTT